MRILFKIFIYILQNFMNAFLIEFVLFCLIFWLWRLVLKGFNL